ncbi:hypothetical protein BDZ45DRAFT_748482 [Acephala macrosclerotiorum]|nr:hypothetical protein BDZ45DRAFT_748482 [Acephala macrosclerotiorum]
MDAIYLNVYVTVIAAAGDGLEHSLPGINDRPRRPQPSWQVGKHHLVSTLPHAQASVGSSKWASRGWNFQEGVLSQRRIIFTDQVYLECNKMSCAESLRLENDDAFLIHIPRPAFPLKSLELHAEQMISCIAEFTIISRPLLGIVLGFAKWPYFRYAVPLVVQDLGTHYERMGIVNCASPENDKALYKWRSKGSLDGVAERRTVRLG